jgi:hypothetical protein
MTMGSGKTVSPQSSHPFIGPTCFTNIWSPLELVNSVKLSVPCYSYTQEILEHQFEKKTRVFCSMLFSVLSTGGLYRKPYPTLVFKIHTRKIRETRKHESIHEYHFVERKNEGRKPDKNSSLRTKNLPHSH